MPTALSSDIKIKLPGGRNYQDVLNIVESGDLHTVCQSAPSQSLRVLGRPDCHLYDPG